MITGRPLDEAHSRESLETTRAEQHRGENKIDNLKIVLGTLSYRRTQLVGWKVVGILEVITVNSLGYRKAPFGNVIFCWIYVVRFVKNVRLFHSKYLPLSINMRLHLVNKTHFTYKIGRSLKSWNSDRKMLMTSTDYLQDKKRDLSCGFELRSRPVLL